MYTDIYFWNIITKTLDEFESKIYKFSSLMSVREKEEEEEEEVVWWSEAAWMLVFDIPFPVGQGKTTSFF